MKQLPLPIGPPVQPGFDNFVAAGNEAAVAHLRKLAEPMTSAPAAVPAPVYLWGSAGVGKTHLLRSLCGAVRSHAGCHGWFDPSVETPWAVSPDWAVAVIDDCHRLDAAQQHAAFTLFVEAAGMGLQIAAAGAAPPVDLAVREDLRTRLAWGHVFQLQALDDNCTRAAIRREADRRGFVLNDDVMHYLMTRFDRNLSRQMALLDLLDDYSMSEHRVVTVPLLKRMLAQPLE